MEITAKKSYDLIKILSDINLAPAWRPLADKCADYYDSNQLSAQELADMTEKGLPPLVVNLIKPTIDVVLGMEEKTRTDWRVDVESGEDAESDELAEALSSKLHEAEKDCKADRACSEAYAAQVKAGLGWVEVSRDSNPYRSPYRTKYIHRNEIDWDWRSREFDLSDARFLVRRKWYDNDVLAAMFPNHADKIKGAVGGLNAWDQMLHSGSDTGLVQSYDIERSGTMEDSEWTDMGRNRTCLFEVWYRTYEAVHVIKIKGRTIEFDQENQIHTQLYQAGLVEVKSALVDRVRQAFWVGPHLLLDRESPYNHNKFPYVPFFGFREDLTGIPYGLIRSMLSSQDEVNARRAKMYWLLSTRRVIADNDVVKDHVKAADEIARPDAYIILSEDRKDGSKFVVEENGTLAKDQFQVMADAAENINRTAGIQQTLMNDSSTSGKAKELDIEQGVTTLAEINGNYRNARIEVGELLLFLVKEDIGNEQISVPLGVGKSRKIIQLNQPLSEQVVDGVPKLNNDVQRAMAKVTLDSVPSTPTYRQQLSRSLMDMTKYLPPQVQGMVLDFVIESSDLPERHKIADRIRKGLNIQSEQEGPTPAEQKMQQQIEQMGQDAKAAIEELQGEVAGLEENLQKEKAQGLADKRAISEIKLEEARLKLDALRQPGEDESVVQAKFEILAEQVGRLTRYVESKHPTT
jgi:hypothetical protein